jgi:hypothetical protein
MWFFRPVAILLLINNVSCFVDSIYGEVKVFEDVSNWDKNRLPCKSDRVILEEGGSVVIDSAIQLRELVFPLNGVVILGDHASIEFFENAEDDPSCPGEDLFFGVKSSSTSSSTSKSRLWSALSRLFADLFIIAVIILVIGLVYLNRTRGFGVWESLTFIQVQISSGLSSLYVTRPIEGTFDFVRFQGDDDNIQLGIESHQTTRIDSEVSSSLQDDDPIAEAATASRPRSLRNKGFRMSEIKESDEEEVIDIKETNLLSFKEEEEKQ